MKEHIKYKKMEEKRGSGKKIFEILKYNLLFVFIIVLFFSITGVYAGDVVFKEGDLNMTYNTLYAVEKLNIDDGFSGMSASWWSDGWGYVQLVNENGGGNMFKSSATDLAIGNAGILTSRMYGNSVTLGGGTNALAIDTNQPTLEYSSSTGNHNFTDDNIMTSGTGTLGNLVVNGLITLKDNVTIGSTTSILDFKKSTLTGQIIYAEYGEAYFSFRPNKATPVPQFNTWAVNRIGSSTLDLFFQMYTNDWALLEVYGGNGFMIDTYAGQPIVFSQDRNNSVMNLTNTNVYIANNLTVDKLIGLRVMTLPVCNSITNGTMGRNLTGVYGCGHDSVWKFIY